MLTGYPELISGFSTRPDGTMALQGGFDNRQQYLQSRGLDPKRTIHAGLVHGATTTIVTAQQGGKVVEATDGLITAEANLGLAMTAADCLLISVYDPQQQVIGLVHAGSKGLAAEVITAFLTTWRAAFTGDPQGFIVDISPSICSEHYPVASDFASKYSEWPEACEKRGDSVHLDLRRIARTQLIAGGVVKEHITASPDCTYKDERYFSYRRDHPTESQLQVGYLLRRD